MAKVPAYARFTYTMTMLKKEIGDTAFDGCDEVLSYLAVKESEGKLVKVTELVQSLQFGAGPTVFRKVRLLAERGYISIRKSSTDGRANDLSLTALAIEHLKERTRLLTKCLKG